MATTLSENHFTLHIADKQVLIHDMFHNVQ